MKFRESFQVFRSDSHGAEEGGRPGTVSYFRIPGVKERQSTTTLSNVAGDQQQAEPKGTPKKKAMQDFLQKTGASLKATGAKLERRIPRKKSKVVRSATTSSNDTD